MSSYFSKIFGTGKSNDSKGKGRRRKGKLKKDESTFTRFILEDINLQGGFKQGYGPKKTECQDSFCIFDQKNEKDQQKKGEKLKEKADYTYFAVYDGHGISGKEASQAANDYILQYFEKRISQIKRMNTHKKIHQLIKNAFKVTEKKLKCSGIDYNNSGTCAISIFLKEQNCFIANLGDSRAVLFRKFVTKKGVQNQAIELSWDHKPTRPSEKERIRKRGGKIERLINEKRQPVGPFRVWQDEEGPGIAMARTLGDFAAKKIGLISEPEIQNLELTNQDQFIIIASDGVWDVLSSTEAVGFVIEKLQVDKMLNKKPAGNIAEALVQYCRDIWDKQNQQKLLNQNKKEMQGAQVQQQMQQIGTCDDITVVIGFFKFREEKVNKKEGAKGRMKKTQKRSQHSRRQK